jgi:hypothetical protein
MPIATIPNGLKPIAEGYSIGDMGGVMETEVSGGFSRYALDYARGVHAFSITILVNSIQLSVWTAFYHHVIKKGAYPFYMQLNSGVGVMQHVCNIIPNSQNITHAGGDVMVISFAVKAENSVYEMSNSDAVTIVDVYNIYGDSSNELFNYLYKFANIDSNVMAGI